jgi:hypothetical protein
MLEVLICLKYIVIYLIAPYFCGIFLGFIIINFKKGYKKNKGIS